MPACCYPFESYTFACYTGLSDVGTECRRRLAGNNNNNMLQDLLLENENWFWGKGNGAVSFSHIGGHLKGPCLHFLLLNPCLKVTSAEVAGFDP
ncbi:hypothetical protein V5799_031035 [Amblyomma americanum]|uniref:Uncharacterized protein n=1 Tax=Amblyomma americanum TaxID=6943 RepID=A0AAQ4EM14_AMBAM